MRGKKASGFQFVQVAMYSIITIFIIGLGIGALFYATTASSVSGKVVNDLKHETYARQLTGNDKCFAYLDNVAGRVDQRVLDKEKLDVAHLQGCMIINHDPQHYLPTRIDITYGEDPDKKKTITTSSWTYQSADTTKKSKDVLIREGEEHKKATISFMFDRPIYTAAAEEEEP